MNRRACLFLLLAPAACSVLPSRPYQERIEWPLEPAPAGVATETQADPGAPPDAVPHTQSHTARPILLVRDTTAGPGLERRGLMRLRADGSLFIDYWNEWAVPPADGVAAAIRAQLAAGHRFRAVLAPGSRDQALLVLDSELDALHAEPGSATAVLSVVLSRNGQPIAQRRLQAQAPLTTDDTAAQVAALRAALAVLLQEVDRFVASAAQ